MRPGARTHPRGRRWPGGVGPVRVRHVVALSPGRAAAPGRARRGGPGWAGSCSSAPWRPNSDSSRGDSKQRHIDPELWFFAAAPGTLLSVSERRQRGVAGRSGDGWWRRLVSRLRRRLPGAVRGQVEVDQVEVDQVEVDQVEVLELSSADSLGRLRAERHGWPPFGPPTPPLARPADPTGQVDPTG
jgi:hypothetical protein